MIRVVQIPRQGQGGVSVGVEETEKGWSRKVLI